MPEILRSLLVVLLVGAAVFHFARPHCIAMGMQPGNYDVQKKLWFGLTLAAFLAHNYFLFAAIAAGLLYVYRKQHSNLAALYAGLLLTVPLFGKDIPGFGIINYFFTLDFSRLLSLCILLPAYLHLRKIKDIPKLGSTWVDKLVLAYLIYGLAKQVPLDTSTNSLRTMFYLALDVVLPYYVASRGAQTIKDLREILVAFLLAVLVVGSIGIIEYAKGWLLYSQLDGALDVNLWGYGGYLRRGESVRALATSGQAIVLGYVMAVGIGLYLCTQNALQNSLVKVAVLLLLLGGLIAPLSRGPWLGAVGVVGIYIIMGPKPAANFFKIVVASLSVGLLLLASPLGVNLVDKLPFVGTVDLQNVDYRERLLDNALIVISRNPYFGSYDYMQAPEMLELRNGGDRGIIDVVNSYVSIALSGGWVGLLLFIAPFAVVLIMLLVQLLQYRKRGDPVATTGRALFAVLLGIMFMIYTVSSILVIPLVHWMFAGLGVCYVKLARTHVMPRP